jgi:hypothetical protein
MAGQHHLWNNWRPETNKKFHDKKIEDVKIYPET